jgi:predicted DNA-binding protein (MmcQ/YjbR family)
VAHDPLETLRPTLMAQELLVEADPVRYFRPPYVGHRGWIGVYLDVEVDWEAAADLVEEGFRLVAPKKLSSLLSTP